MTSPARKDPSYRGDAFLVVKGASGLRDASERLVVVFQCYLDDSGTSGLPIVTMAGFLSPLKNWEEYERRFDAILNHYEVPILHAKEFHDTRGTFKNWSKIKKRTMAEELFSVTERQMHGLSMSSRKADIVAYKKRTGQLPTMSPYGICFATIMTRVVTDARYSARTIKEGVAFLVESGNQNNSEIEQYFHKMSKMPAYKGSMRGISFIAKSSCRAIQVADFFAFYSRRYMRDHDRFSGKLKLPMSSYLSIIEKHCPLWQWGSRGAPEMLPMNIKDFDDINDMVSDAKKIPKS